ncbi:ribonuclease H-like domain-containing protein [Tanacetum coccineum]|uniref:Ribonuclease H-like domain-containing protein n=1 Tax=Tanacetum coccineum TaxID=301880 RepID=A0ABQ5BXA5_9ASTR
MAGDDIPKKGVSSSSSDLNLTFGDPLYLHPNDTGGSPIVTIKLIGIENYKVRSIAMTFALRNHNKIGFIDGSCEKDNTNPALANQLDMCDSVDTYDKVDGSAVFKLHKSINSLNQSGASLADYYNNLNSLWKQFVGLLFLMGLDDNYLAIRSNILTREPLPLVKAAFAIVSDEESHRNITSVEATKPTTTTFASKCFELVGYPAGCVKRYFNPTSRFVSNNNTSVNIHSNGVSSNNATTNNSHVSLSNEQLTRLMNLLNDNGVSTDNANMAEYTVSLLSVHKLSRDSKLFVGFDESNCYIRDLKENMTVEIGKQFNGLYLFDIDNACKIVSNNCIASCYVSKTPIPSLELSAPRKWNEKLVSVLKENDFVQSVNDHSLFTKSKDNKFIALLVYVDDIVVTRNCINEITKFKSFLKSKFNIKDLGKYRLLGCKPVSTPMEPNYVLPYIATKDVPLLDNITSYQKLLGKLIYLTHTRPDISYPVHYLAQYMHSPLKSHLNCA